MQMVSPFWGCKRTGCSKFFFKGRERGKKTSKIWDPPPPELIPEYASAPDSGPFFLEGVLSKQYIVKYNWISKMLQCLKEIDYFNSFYYTNLKIIQLFFSPISYIFSKDELKNFVCLLFSQTVSDLVKYYLLRSVANTTSILCR